MAVESTDKFSFPKLLFVEEDKKGSDYQHLLSFSPITNFPNPKLFSSYPNIPNPKSMSRNTNPNYCDNNNNNNNNYCDDDSYESEKVEETPMRVVRSVVAGVLLKRYDEVSVFTPLHTQVVLDYLIEDYLLSESEKEALLEVGALFYEGDGDNREEDQTIKLAINQALLSIEAETGAISCDPVVFAGSREKSVYVMSIQPNKLVAELSPLSLRFDNLCISAHDLFPDLQQREEDRQKELREMARAFKV